MARSGFSRIACSSRSFPMQSLLRASRDSARRCDWNASTVAMAPFTVAFDGAEGFRGRPGHRPFVLRGEDGVADRRVDTVS